MPGELSLRLYQGQSKTLFITWKSDTGVVRSLTGCTFRLVGKRSKSDTATTLNLTTANGKAILDTAKGYDRIKLVFSASDTLAVPFGQGWFDLFVDFPDGSANCLISDSYHCDRRVATPNA